MVEQIFVIWVFRPAESKSGLNFGHFLSQIIADFYWFSLKHQVLGMSRQPDFPEYMSLAASNSHLLNPLPRDWANHFFAVYLSNSLLLLIMWKRAYFAWWLSVSFVAESNKINCISDNSSPAMSTREFYSKSDFLDIIIRNRDAIYIYNILLLSSNIILSNVFHDVTRNRPWAVASKKWLETEFRRTRSRIHFLHTKSKYLCRH